MNPHRTVPRADRFQRARFAALLREAGLDREADRIAPDPFRLRALPACRCYCGLVVRPIVCSTCRAFGVREVTTR